MQYCTNCGNSYYDCDCIIDEDYNSFMSDMDYDSVKANQVLDDIISPEKQNLIELVQALKLTKSEIRELIDRINAGKLDGGLLVMRDCGCIVGLTTLIRGIKYDTTEWWNLAELTFIYSDDPQYETIERFIMSNRNHAQVVEWLLEIAS